MTEKLTVQIREALPELVLFQEEPMKNHTTFRVGGPAQLYACPTCKELPILLQLAKNAGIAVTVIGNGSNLLVGDKGIRGLVIEMGRSANSVTVEGCRVKAEAGALLSRTAHTAYEAGLGGMEFAAGIPGSVGGAVAMNAGAHDGEIKDILESAEVLTTDGQILSMTAEELDLSYRHSCIFEKNYIVLSGTFLLKEKDPEEIAERMAELKEKRTSKQPLEYPSAGSTFKRPEGHFAGKLIQDAGLRGYSVGGAQVSEKHCGFVINKGGATAADILQLIEDVQAKVLQESGVMMEPEVRMLGDF